MAFSSGSGLLQEGNIEVIELDEAVYMSSHSAFIWFPMSEDWNGLDGKHYSHFISHLLFLLLLEVVGKLTELETR